MKNSGDDSTVIIPAAMRRRLAPIRITLQPAP